MQNTSVLPEATRALLNAAFKTGIALGRKFEREDLTPELRQAARQYASTYAGDFDYMLSMRNAVLAGGAAFLSDGQSKAVLNCLLADGKRRQAARPKTVAEAVVEAAPARETPIGTFTVVFPDGHVTIRLQKPQDKSKAAEGVVYAKYLAGPGNTADFQYFAAVVGGKIRAKGFERQVVALKVVLTSTGGELGKMGLAYAMASSNCFYCGRTLTVPASIHSGMGPDCAAKHGGDYSEPEAPAPAETPEVTVQEPTPAAQATRNTTDAIDAQYREENRLAQERYDALVREDGETDQSWKNRRYDAMFGHTH